MKRHGFTLIELVMVIVIIGILAAIAIPRFVSLREDAIRAACEANVGALRAAISNSYAQSAIAGTAAFPADIADATFITTFMQAAPPAPVIGNWSDHYTAATGILDMAAACGTP